MSSNGYEAERSAMLQDGDPEGAHETMRFYTWCFGEGPREHANYEDWCRHWNVIRCDPYARYWSEVAR